MVTKIKSIEKIFLSIFLLCSFPSYGDEFESTDPAKMSALASKIITSAEIDMIMAKGASQVTQLASQTQLQLSKIIIKQNEEMIRLMRKISEKK